MKGFTSFAAFLAGAVLAGLIVLVSIYSGIENFDLGRALAKGGVHVAMVILNYAACLTAALLIRSGIRSRIALNGL